MDEQKRLFTAIILSIVVIVGWNFFFVDPTPVTEKPEQTVSSTQKPETGETDSTPISNTIAPAQQVQADITAPLPL